MKPKPVIAIVAGVVVVAGMAVLHHLRQRQIADVPLVAEVPPMVRTATVAEGHVVRTQHVLGTVIGAEETDLSPQIMARVLAVMVREGDAVKAGALLAVLDEQPFKDALAEAEAARAAAEVADQAQRDATARDRRLFEVKAIAQEQWDRSRAALAAVAAQAQVAARRVDQARTRLGYCRITAPADGVVARRLADPGDLAVPGKPLLQLVRQQIVRVRGALPAEDFTALHPGLPVTLLNGQETVPAVVARVFPALGASHLATFECDLARPPPGLVSGATVGMDVQLSSAQGLVVPANALLEGTRDAWVFVVDHGTVRPVPVEVLDRSLDHVVVGGGLRPGDAVVVAEPSRLMTLAAGTKVQVASNP
jgi:membrane fusion protein, multidrug efflux system